VVDNIFEKAISHTENTWHDIVHGRPTVGEIVEATAEVAAAAVLARFAWSRVLPAVIPEAEGVCGTATEQVVAKTGAKDLSVASEIATGYKETPLARGYFDKKELPIVSSVRGLVSNIKWLR
jgi:hypothetical protein